MLFIKILSATSIVGAMNELITFVSAAEGFFVVDESFELGFASK